MNLTTNLYLLFYYEFLQAFFYNKAPFLCLINSSFFQDTPKFKSYLQKVKIFINLWLLKFMALEKRVRQRKTYSRKIMMLFWYLILGFFALSIYKAKTV